MGVVCACLLLLPAFLQHHLPQSVKAFLSGLLPSSKKSSSHSWRDNQGLAGSWPGYTHQLPSYEPQHSRVRPEGQGLESQRVVAWNDSVSFQYYDDHSHGPGTVASELGNKH